MCEKEQEVILKEISFLEGLKIRLIEKGEQEFLIEKIEDLLFEKYQLLEELLDIKKDRHSSD